ncbi:hypothetical protein EYF80_035720 [Liparis tanakae]|uniref:Uncharacterized protein n=1 Tax=Liparis tanakae TaxID=230148 RepID=A0A4Z2GL90_9TELE|nr:hypothetical protein EYF80_035720 [Liparis tanakae]
MRTRSLSDSMEEWSRGTPTVPSIIDMQEPEPRAPDNISDMETRVGVEAASSPSAGLSIGHESMKLDVWASALGLGARLIRRLKRGPDPLSFVNTQGSRRYWDSSTTPLTAPVMGLSSCSMDTHTSAQEPLQRSVRVIGSLLILLLLVLIHFLFVSLAQLVQRGHHQLSLHSHVTQEVEQRLQDLPVLIRHQQDGRSDGLQPLLLWDRLRQVSEELFDHVGHVVRRLVLVAHGVGGQLTLLPQSLDTGLHAGFAEQSHLRWEGKKRKPNRGPDSRVPPLPIGSRRIAVNQEDPSSLAFAGGGPALLLLLLPLPRLILRQHAAAPVVHDLLQAADVLDDVVQVREQIILFLQVHQVSRAGVEVGARNVVVDAHPAAARRSGTRGLRQRFARPRLTVIGGRSSALRLEAGCSIPGGRHQALYGQRLGKGARLMVFGDVNQEVFVRVELVPAKRAVSFRPLTLREQLGVLQAGSLAPGAPVSPTGLPVDRCLRSSVGETGEVSPSGWWWCSSWLMGVHWSTCSARGSSPCNTGSPMTRGARRFEPFRLDDGPQVRINSMRRKKSLALLRPPCP